MTYLELCQRLRQEARISGTGPDGVTGQVGELGRVVDWIATAYQEVQNARAGWRFLRESFDFSTIASTNEYTPAAVEITDFGKWIAKNDDIRVYSSYGDETHLIYYPWDEFRAVYQYGDRRSQEERPSVISIKPNNALIMWPTPDAVYTIDGEYYKTPDVMVATTDEPAFPSRFHLMVMWKGLMYYGASEAADEKYAQGQNEYRPLLAKLELDQLEDFGYGAPLA